MNEITSPQRRYVLISPCRNEAEYVRTTLESVVNQTLLPSLWIIVDDGSTDATPAILAEYAARYPFVRIVRRQDRGQRSVGPGVIEAFYDGYHALGAVDYDYVCKFDVDLDLPRDYFRTVVARMEAQPRLGTFSGKPYYVAPDGSLVSERIGDEMSAGMIKFYRRQCFEEINGFERAVMWDGIDCHRCRMLGWLACSSDEPELRFTHLRAMGSSQSDIWTGRVRWGFGQYFMGTGPAWLLASAAYRMTRPPLLIGGLGIFWGYVRSGLRRQARYEDAEFRAFLRDYQRACLRYGKARATQRLDERQERVWRSKHT